MKAKHWKNTDWGGFGPFFHETRFEDISKAREMLSTYMKGGLQQTCPCCSQTVKLYARKITSRMVVGLKAIEARGVMLSTDVSQIGGGGGDVSKLRYWGLIQLGITTVVVNGKRTDKRSWKCMPKGVDFLYNNLSIPKYAMIYRDQLFGFSKEMTTIHDCVDDDFDFHDLMRPSNITGTNWQPMPKHKRKGNE